MLGYLVALLSVNCVASAFPHVNHSTQLEIVGGNLTGINQVPYMAAAVSPDRILQCGASIISKNFLLTAAHCCVQSRSFKYRVGSSCYRRGGHLVHVSNVFIHPNYSLDTYPIYDVCLVKTLHPIRFGRTVQPVRIAKEVPEAGNLAQVAGWGMTEMNSLSSVLRSVRVPIASEKYCHNEYPEIKDMSAVLCAGTEGKDSCQGDSGGGLIYKEQLVGIVSFGFGCGISGFPGVYANVLNPSIRNFIRNITGV